MKTKHTPGPWTVGHFSGAECAVQTATYPKRTIAILDDGIVGHRNPENARLISLAPEMLDGLKEVLDVVREAFKDVSRNGEHDTEWLCPLCGTSTEHDEDCPIPKITALVARAEGEA